MKPPEFHSLCGPVYVGGFHFPVLNLTLSVTKHPSWWHRFWLYFFFGATFIPTK